MVQFAEVVARTLQWQTCRVSFHKLCTSGFRVTESKVQAYGAFLWSQNGQSQKQCVSEPFKPCYLAASACQRQAEAGRYCQKGVQHCTDQDQAVQAGPFSAPSQTKNARSLLRQVCDPLKQSLQGD